MCLVNNEAENKRQKRRREVTEEWKPDRNQTNRGRKRMSTEIKMRNNNGAEGFENN